jgi:DNA (cytosine-5)-methyltransferase 1
MIKTIGSICSGIEAASVAWKSFDLDFKWFSEIAEFPSKVLKTRYPSVVNLGDMNKLSSAIVSRRISSPDLICGGTPCQTFSTAGLKNGLNDSRGCLTLKFVEIVECNDRVRLEKGLSRSVVFWENVEGVLTDSTNSFGHFISLLSGFKNPINLTKWPEAGFVRGLKRNVAWRVLDAKYFGLPQQRRRLYVLAGGKEFNPESVVFEKLNGGFQKYPTFQLKFTKNVHSFEVFREYTDCLYSAYGTKWNGNAAANNGSLYIIQNERIRRFSPLECERLMGLPDNYTDIPGSHKTNRYKAIGNSWAVPVVNWIGKRLFLNDNSINSGSYTPEMFQNRLISSTDNNIYDLSGDIVLLSNGVGLNTSIQPNDCVFSQLYDIVDFSAPESIYLSPVGSYGIIRRKNERNLAMNNRLEEILINTSSLMKVEEIEKKSRKQRRGSYSQSVENQLSIEMINRNNTTQQLLTV